MEIIFIVWLSLCLVGALVWAIYECRQARTRIEFNEEIKERNDALAREAENLEERAHRINNDVQVGLDALKSIKMATSDALESQKDMAEKAFENYCEVLSKRYDEQDAEYEEMSDKLNEAYATLQDRITEEIETQKSELEKIRATRAALIQAQVKEKEIQENKDFYCLKVSEDDLDDIRRLERVKNELHNKRILSMLIWQTFFQKGMTSLCNNILGTTTITGIYKITNLNTNMCYIGQAVDVSTRWKDHAKCGLGIDTPPGNKLYAAMQEDGIWNFSWELLEKCDRKLLDEKEKYYIGIYQSKDYGYNITKGNK